jgi:TM2 domain-containing membrane protein YozV
MITISINSQLIILVLVVFVGAYVLPKHKLDWIKNIIFRITKKRK